MARWLSLFAVISAVVALSVCGSRTPTTPTQSAAVPTYTLSGVVSDATTTRPVPGAAVGVTSGPNADHGSSTDANGFYSIAGLVKDTFTVHTTASGYTAIDKTVALTSNARLDLGLQPVTPVVPQCDSSLWSHVHDAGRLQIFKACQTVTGFIRDHYSSDDGDIDMQLALDAPFTNLLNNGNIAKLNGNLQTEAICQAPIHSDVPDAFRACGSFTGSVLIPPVGAHVQVTGVYTLDKDHGWMEIHPISVITLLP